MTDQNRSQNHESSDERHELLRDAVEDALRSTIKKLDHLQVRCGQEKYTYTEVNWVLAHVIHDLIRFGSVDDEEPTSWTNVEEFIRKLRLTNLDERYLRNGKPPWVPLTYDPSLDARSISWFYSENDAASSTICR
jgi:hypothetical protein